MKQIRNFLLALALALPGMLWAQRCDFENYTWEDGAKMKPVEARHPESSAEVLFDERMTEYSYAKDGKLECYNLKHTIVRVNNDKGIERFNKLYVGVSDVIDMLQLKARTVSPKGVLKEISEKDIMEITDDEDGEKYRILALEGIEKGSLIEYYYVSQNQYQLYARQTFQNDLPVAKALFELISPENLIFKLKGYNGFPATIDTVVGEKRYMRTDTFAVKPIFEEKYANIRANMMKVEYKLAYNTARGKAPMMTYAESSKNLYANIYRPQDKPSKALEKAVKGLKLKNLTMEEQAATIENYFKTNISIKTDLTESKNVDQMLSEKVADESGMADLLVHALEMANIKTELVLTTNRFTTLFDDQFETYNFLSKYLIYLPELDKYIAPGEFQYRLGITPINYIGNYGLFVRSVDIGGMKMGLGAVKKINPPPLETSYENIYADVNFDLSKDQVNIDYKKEMDGYISIFFKPVYPLLSKENQDKLTQDLLKSVSEDAKLSDIKVSNTDMSDVKNKAPFTLEAKMNIPSVLEHAGSKYLFKIGELIGPQAEMYQDKERQMGIEVEYLHKYKRVIRFKVPDGYEVQGLDKAKLDVTLEYEGKKSSGFVSNYQVGADGWVTVTAEEYYGELRYPVSKFEDYRKVINAAADFNKVVLVFVKK